jgi:hypothetical protein
MTAQQLSDLCEEVIDLLMSRRASRGEVFRCGLTVVRTVVEQMPCPRYVVDDLIGKLRKWAEAVDEYLPPKQDNN